MEQATARSHITRVLGVRRGSVLALAVLGACQPADQSGVGTDTAPRDRVSYATFAPASLDIYLFERTGAVPRRLTDHPALDYDAVVSPDGRWLIFCSERRGNPDLYVLDLQQQGSEPRLLIDSGALEDQAAFSPDGVSLAFVSTVSGNAEVFVLPFAPDTTAAMNAARNVTNHAAGDFRPAFSPDGRMLVFSSDRDQPITTPPNAPRSITRESSPSWSN